MTTIMPKGEKLRNAVKWISAELQGPNADSLLSLIEKAALQFNLSPKEEEYLKIFYEQQEKEISTPE
ncbi:MAG: hypothetical protein DRG39_01620 [Deltaproteobacteria bacterium]|nr:MAG: hypothetical protein DRG39_01620 [Deltaproteobacteria bacterium]